VEVKTATKKQTSEKDKTKGKGVSYEVESERDIKDEVTSVPASRDAPCHETNL
jgi:hypothetical protein